MTMPNFSYKLVFMSAFLVIGSTLGGWALTDKLAGAEAARSFLTLGGAVAFSVIALQSVFYFAGKERLFYRLIFGVAYTSSVVWFLMCLFLPLFWVATIPVYIKLLIILAAIPLCACNYMLALTQFRGRWAERGEACFAKLYDCNAGVLDWPKLVASMKLHADLYLPGIPSRANPAISAAMVASMLLGLNLRNAFAVFSILAWSIPCVIGISILVQITGLGIAQLSKIRELEKASGRAIRPAA